MLEWLQRNVDRLFVGAVIVVFGSLAVIGIARTTFQHGTPEPTKKVAPKAPDAKPGHARNSSCSCGDSCKCYDCASGGCANRSCCAVDNESEGGQCCVRR